MSAKVGRGSPSAEGGPPAPDAAAVASQVAVLRASAAAHWLAVRARGCQTSSSPSVAGVTARRSRLAGSPRSMAGLTTAQAESASWSDPPWARERARARLKTLPSKNAACSSVTPMGKPPPGERRVTRTGSSRRLLGSAAQVRATSPYALPPSDCAGGTSRQAHGSLTSREEAAAVSSESRLASTNPPASPSVPLPGEELTPSEAGRAQREGMPARCQSTSRGRSSPVRIPRARAAAHSPVASAQR
mmetsp:Transcript_17303/g.65551  ORF Transcript_17303/g.65551 Transcript_17303/m.65551 type:complete len:246 (-) Transcript_17303:1570-2307(-)